MKLFSTMVTSLRSYHDIVLLDELYKEVKKSRDVVAKWNRILEDEVSRRIVAIKSLLDNAGQGFLSFGADLVIHKEYSLACKTIFNRDINGENIVKLLYRGDLEQQLLMKDVFQKVFATKDVIRQKNYLQLLSDEMTINDLNINIEYKLITRSDEVEIKSIMAILTDVSEKRELENELKKVQGG